MNTQPATPYALPSLWSWVLGVPLGGAVILVGLWLFAAQLGPGYYGSIGFAIGWFTLAWIAIGRVGKRVPALSMPLRAVYLAIVLVVGGYSAWTTFTDKTVNEQIAVGAPSSASGGAGGNVELSRGPFVGVAHGASGTAAVVKVASGEHLLTFSALDTDNGPDLRVYLVAGAASGDGDVDDFVDLGALKGNKGNQQYAIPADTDLERYATVVIWCRAFSVSFAKAELATS
ncbi:MAG: DM13 domain-containing protein [Gaiella sp.]